MELPNLFPTTPIDVDVFVAPSAYVRAHASVVDAATATGSGVGCVGVALLLRAGAGVVEAFAGDARRDGAVGAAEDAKAFGMGLEDRCDDAGERRTRRRVERALRGM